ncbi:MAG: hypothetical protein ABIR11_02555 [Candidatus Limnocylindrales bacterium]
MSDLRPVMHLTSGGQGDGFLAVVERLERESDPLREATDGTVGADAGPRARPPAGAGDPGAFERLVESLRGRLDLPRPASVAQALRNADLRTAFLAEVGALTGAEVAQVAGSRAKNSSALASRWRSERRIFAVPWSGELLYPAFQFADGAPRPAVARILEAFGDPPSGWEIALWFATPSAFLPGSRRPLELLDSDPDALVAAARAELSAPEF